MEPISSKPHPSVSSFKHFGLTLILLRLVRGLSQGELADVAGIRPNQISRYETGQVLPQLAQVERLSDALELDPVTLFTIMAQVQSLVGLIEKVGPTPARAAAEIQAMLAKLNLMQLSLGDQLRDVFVRRLEETRAGEPAGRPLVHDTGLTPEFLEAMAAEIRQQQKGAVTAGAEED